MSSYLPRLAGRVVADDLKVFPVVVLTGARQTGKSTLARENDALSARPYLTLDDLSVRDQARSAPEDLLERHRPSSRPTPRGPHGSRDTPAPTSSVICVTSPAFRACPTSGG